MNKFKGFVVPDFTFGNMGEMMARCVNARSMESCSGILCDDCLFNYDDHSRYKTFRAWIRFKSRLTKPCNDLPTTGNPRKVATKPAAHAGYCGAF